MSLQGLLWVACSLVWTEAKSAASPSGVPVSGCSHPLGLMSGAVEDWQLSASSSATRDPECDARHGRLLRPSGSAWCAGHRAAFEWIQVDLGVTAKRNYQCRIIPSTAVVRNISQVTGLLTQGRADGHQWVLTYLVSHSMDAFHWKYCTDAYGARKVFKGNNDSHSVKHSYLEHPVSARFMRIHVLEWHQHPSLRLEIIGCQTCNEVISLPPSASIAASSWRPWSKQQTCWPEDAHIYSHGGWCAKKSDAHQWIQTDLGPATLVTGLITKGRGDSKRKQWVTSYTVSYSNDSVLWYAYKDDTNLDPKIKEFGGNMDRDTERRHYLNHPFVSRFVRIHPRTWHGRLAMRLGVIGCRHKGDCGPGFLRIHEDSSCVENVAFKRETWVNDKRHNWPGWKYGHSSFAVDGDEDNHLQKCAILDNYYVDSPIWMVDLGRKRNVRGLLVVTWQGKGQDRSTQYREYLYNLDRLTAYVEDKPHLESLNGARKCATVSRLNNALFRSQLHFECPDNLEGRFVYLKAAGIVNRWTRLFTAVLCEVMVY